MKKRNIWIFVVIFSLLLLIVGGTYAYWIWTSSEKSVYFNTASGLENYIVYDEGNSHFIGNFQPTETFCESANTTISFYKTSEATDIDIYATINMNINSIGTNVSKSNDVYWVLTSGDNTISCSGGLSGTSEIISSGTFSLVSAGDTIVLANNLEVTTTEQKFTVWIWIDSNGTDLSLLSGETIDTNIWTQFDMVATNKPESPRLDDGMIPVTISDTGVTTTISRYSSNWYNYENKEWANAILVTSDSRSKYLETDGVTVEASDILAYYVWIPRYKYKIWTTEVSSAGNEQSIDIMFETRGTPMTLGKNVGEYRTHPAFWWDDDSDGVVDNGEMLSGIWVGKFESTGDETTPTVLPDKTSLRGQNVSTQFTTSLKFSGGTLTDGIVTYVGSDIYGLTTKTNSHMMKNSEWGAVAYLSHSKYGANREIYVNNSGGRNSVLTNVNGKPTPSLIGLKNNYTGRSGGNVSGSTAINTVYTDQTSTSQYNDYGFYTWDGYLLDYDTNTKGTTHDISKVASTTGNITGIYDMSGGSWEYVMGNLENNAGGSEFSTFPESKYYDAYTTSTLTTACDGGICFGHALSETNSWYYEHSSFLDTAYPWLVRGGMAAIDGRIYTNYDAGVFSYDDAYGSYIRYVSLSGTSDGTNYSIYGSWRSVLVIV